MPIPTPEASWRRNAKNKTFGMGVLGLVSTLTLWPGVSLWLNEIRVTKYLEHNGPLIHIGFPFKSSSSLPKTVSLKSNQHCCLVHFFCPNWLRASHYGFQHCSHFGNCFVSLLLHKKLPLHQQPFYSLLKATFQLSLTILWVGWFSSWFLLGTLKSLAPWLEQLCSGTLGLEDPSFFIWPLSLVALAGWPGLLRAVQSSVKCKT